MTSWGAVVFAKWVKQCHENNVRLRGDENMLACTLYVRDSPDNIALWLFSQKLDHKMKLKFLHVNYIIYLFIHEYGFMSWQKKLDLQKVSKPFKVSFYDEWVFQSDNFQNHHLSIIDQLVNRFVSIHVSLILQRHDGVSWSLLRLRQGHLVSNQ